MAVFLTCNYFIATFHTGQVCYRVSQHQLELSDYAYDKLFNLNTFIAMREKLHKNQYIIISGKKKVERV